MSEETKLPENFDQHQKVEPSEESSPCPHTIIGDLSAGKTHLLRYYIERFPQVNETKEIERIAIILLPTKNFIPGKNNWGLIIDEIQHLEKGSANIGKAN